MSGVRRVLRWEIPIDDSAHLVGVEQIDVRLTEPPGNAVAGDRARGRGVSERAAVAELDTAAIRRRFFGSSGSAVIRDLCEALDEARAALALTATHLASARAELERLRAGEDPTPVPENAWPTPGQWIRRFNEAPPEERLAVVARALEDARVAGDCFLRNHDGRIRHHDGALLALRAQRDALAAAVDGPFGAHEFTGPDGDGRTVCTSCSGIRANRVHRTARVILACLADGTDPRAHPFRADGDRDACDLNWCQEPADHPIHEEARRG